MVKYFSAAIFLFFLLGNVSAQNVGEDWVPVVQGENLVFIDMSNIKSFTGDDIFVWTYEKHSSPLKIDGINKDIYQSNTYYLFNKKLMKYSILEIIYYDKKGNVIKDFTYRINNEVEDLKYSYPVLESSLPHIILLRCLREINSDG